MKAKIVRLPAISAIILLTATTLAIVYAYSNDVNLQHTDQEYLQEHDHDGDCDELMEQWMREGGTYGKHNGMMHGETEDSDSSLIGCY